MAVAIFKLPYVTNNNSAPTHSTNSQASPKQQAICKCNCNCWHSQIVSEIHKLCCIHNKRLSNTMRRSKLKQNQINYYLFMFQGHWEKTIISALDINNCVNLRSKRQVILFQTLYPYHVLYEEMHRFSEQCCLEHSLSTKLQNMPYTCCMQQECCVPCAFRRIAILFVHQSHNSCSLLYFS